MSLASHGRLALQSSEFDWSREENQREVQRFAKSNNMQRPRRRVIYVLALLILVIKPGCAEADDEGSAFGSWMKFYAGIASGFLIHEGAHALVAGSTGTDIDWKLGDINQPFLFEEHANSDAAGLAINSAGLVSQVMGSEIILQVDKIDKNDPFVRGMMLWNIVNPILYTLDYWFIHATNKKNGDTYEGDIKGVERYSDKTTANGFALGIFSIAAFQGYRFLKTQTWAPDWLKNNCSNVTLAPLLSGGLAFSYTFAF